MELGKTAHKRFSPLEFVINNAAFVICVLLILYNSIFRANFLRMNTFWNIISQTSSLLFCAMGMTVVISAGCTDLSISAMMAISSAICGTLMIKGWNVGAAILVAIVVCAILGIVNGTLVAKLKFQPMVAMLITRMVYRAGANLYTQGITKVIPSTSFSKMLGTGRITSLRMPVVVIPVVLIILITWFIVKKTSFGKRIESVGNNQRTAYLCGISVVGTIFGAYVLSACFAGLGGILDLFRSNALDTNTVGIDYEMTAIAAATIGGTSMRGGKAKIMGTVFGALLMTLITMTINFANVIFEMSNMLKGLIILFAIAIQQLSSKQ